MSAPELTMSPLRISTTVTTCHAGCGIRLKRLFDNFGLWAIPFGYPGEGFLKMEYESKVVGSSTRDVLTKRKVTDKTFFNQATLVIRKAFPPERGGWKEVNIKLFANGGIQMTGVPTPEFSQEAIKFVINEIKSKDSEVFAGSAEMCKFRIQLINSDYSINRQIYQDKLHKVLSNVYNLFSSHESTIYQGVNTKYYYNKKGNPLRPGICECKAACTGQGDGDGEGQCKRITISPFSSGKIIITGARDMDQINEAYEFFNDILMAHQNDILFVPTAPAAPAAPLAPVVPLATVAPLIALPVA
jgi:TATA-box binding protein (TBP) (component of TFIID and TFIIIB)